MAQLMPEYKQNGDLFIELLVAQNLHNYQVKLKENIIFPSV